MLCIYFVLTLNVNNSTSSEDSASWCLLGSNLHTRKLVWKNYSANLKKKNCLESAVL